jgi:hypothetical protein
MLDVFIASPSSDLSLAGIERRLLAAQEKPGRSRAKFDLAINTKKWPFTQALARLNCVLA